MSLVAGSYERFIWGYKFKSQTLTLSPLFSFPSHISAIKSVAVSGSVAASGASDDTIKIYDLSTSSEIGSLTEHSSTVTSLVFFTPPSLSFPRNLISADDSGHVCIYDSDPFVHLKTINAHKKGINSISVHPSGKLALSVGRDSCLAMLNLVRGRRSFYCRLGKEASIVKFDSSGEKFFMAVDDKISVHEAEDAKLVFELDSSQRINCVVPGMNGVLFTGGEDKGITGWDTSSGKLAYRLDDAHSSRVKGIVVLSGSGSASEDGDQYTFASASSDGLIRVWDIRMANKEKPNPLAEANTKSRLTCLAGSSLKSSRRPRVGKNNGESEEDAADE